MAEDLRKTAKYYPDDRIAAATEELTAAAENLRKAEEDLRKAENRMAAKDLRNLENRMTAESAEENLWKADEVLRNLENRMTAAAVARTAVEIAEYEAVEAAAKGRAEDYAAGFRTGREGLDFPKGVSDAWTTSFRKGYRKGRRVARWGGFRRKGRN